MARGLIRDMRRFPCHAPRFSRPSQEMRRKSFVITIHTARRYANNARLMMPITFQATTRKASRTD